MLAAEAPALEIPPAAVAAAGGLCVLVGAALVVWGRKGARVILMLLGAGAGGAAAPLLVPYLPYKNVWVIGAAGAFTGAIVLFLLAKLFWALVLAGTAFLAGAAGVVWLVGDAVGNGPAWSEYTWTDGLELCRCLADYAVRWFSATWAYSPVALALAAGLPALAAIALALWVRDVMLIVVTSAVGAIGMVCGAGTLAWMLRPEWVAGWLERVHVPLAAAGVLAVGGIVVQVRSKLRQRARAEEKRREGPGDQPDRAGPDGGGSA